MQASKVTCNIVAQRYRRDVTRWKDLKKEVDLWLMIWCNPFLSCQTFCCASNACLPSLLNKHQSSIVVTSEKGLRKKVLSLRRTHTHTHTHFFSPSLSLFNTQTHSLCLSFSLTHTHFLIFLSRFRSLFGDSNFFLSRWIRNLWANKWLQFVYLVRLN